MKSLELIKELQIISFKNLIKSQIKLLYIAHLLIEFQKIFIPILIDISISKYKNMLNNKLKYFNI